MSDSDFSPLGELVEAFDEIPKNAQRNIVSAIKRTSVEIKQDWQQGAERRGLADYAASVDFDIESTPHMISSHIGPNQEKRQGRFGFVEDAHGDVHSAPQHAGRDALEANEDDFYEGMEIAIFDATAQAIIGPMLPGVIGPKGG